jgi:cyanophycinase-like exopeptidase
LLADSQLLFWRGSSGSFLDSIFQSCANQPPSIAYIGASNADSPDAFAILQAALSEEQIACVQHIRATFPETDRRFLMSADVLVLAGGDVVAGWNVFTETGMRDVIATRRREGAVLVGVSAGAVQFGTHAVVQSDSGALSLVETFGFVPMIIDAHDEQRDWASLAGTVHLLEGTAVGIGIPSGGGLIAYPDGTLEPIRHAISELTFRDGSVRRAILLPK